MLVVTTGLVTIVASRCSLHHALLHGMHFCIASWHALLHATLRVLLSGCTFALAGILNFSVKGIPLKLEGRPKLVGRPLHKLGWRSRPGRAVF